MARNIGADGTDVFRAVTTITDPRTGEQHVKHEGPYGSAGAARGRVTFWVNRCAEYDDEGERTGSRAHGDVEQAHTVWAPVGEPAPQPAPDHAAIRGHAYSTAANEVALLRLPPAVLALGGIRAKAAREALHAAAAHLWRRAAEIHPAGVEAITQASRRIPLDIAECPGTCRCRRQTPTEEPSK